MKKRSSKKISPKVGDRFQSRSNNEFVVEYQGNDWVVINNTVGVSYAVVGEIIRNGNLGISFGNYNYIGNFSKPDSFEQLYNLFNDTK